jgi:hypothetical protein
MAEDPAKELDRIAGLLEQVLGKLRTIEVRIDTLEAQIDMASVADIDGALDEVRAEVRSIKDEML